MNRNVVTILGVLALVLGAGLAVVWIVARERAQGSAAPGTRDETREPAAVSAPEAPAPPVVDERAPAAPSAPDAAPAPLVEAELALHGRVLAAEDGSPLAKARVAARESAGATLIESETDDQGAYRFDFAGAAPEALDLAASFPGRESRVLRGLKPGAPDAVPDLLLQKGFTVTGRVLALGDRRPIEDAEVALSAAMPGFDPIGLDTSTDEGGAFEFAGVSELPRDALQLTVVADGFVAEQRALEALDEQARSLTVEILLADRVLISGEVFDGVAGKAIPGATVELDSSRGEWVEETVEAISDDEGRFQIELREFPPRSACLFARGAGFQTTCQRLAQLQFTDHVQVGRMLLFPPVVLRGSAVEDGSTRRPREGVVRARPKDVPEEIAERFQDSVSLRKDGTFELALVNAPAGCPLEIVVEAKGYLPGAKDLQIQPQAHPEPVTGLELRLARAMRLHGIVVGSGNAPLAGARVQWWSPATAGALRIGGETVTNDQGLFYLDVPQAQADLIRVSVEYHGRRAVWPARPLELSMTDVGESRGRPVLALPGAAPSPPESGR